MRDYLVFIVIFVIVKHMCAQFEDLLRILHLKYFRTYLKPLLRLLKKQTVTDDVLDSLVKMVVLCLQKDYILSHEAYMEMAVGNAPWPIGKIPVPKF